MTTQQSVRRSSRGAPIDEGTRVEGCPCAIGRVRLRPAARGRSDGRTCQRSACANLAQPSLCGLERQDKAGRVEDMCASPDGVQRLGLGQKGRPIWRGEVEASCGKAPFLKRRGRHQRHGRQRSHWPARTVGSGTRPGVLVVFEGHRRSCVQSGAIWDDSVALGHHDVDVVAAACVDLPRREHDPG
jgi:hypothetical protein